MDDSLSGELRDFRRMLGYSALFHLTVFLGVLTLSFAWVIHPLASPVYEVDLVSLPAPKPAEVKKPPVPAKTEAAKPKPPVEKKEAPKPKPVQKPSPPPLAAVPPPPEPEKKEPQPEPLTSQEVPADEEAATESPASEAPPDPLAAIPAPDVQIQAEVEIPDFEYPYYLELIRRKIGRQWSPPRLHAGTNIHEAVVEFQLFAKGTMTEIRITKSSGNAFFDQAALRAIYQANPLPPLPQGLNKETLSIKLQFVLGRKS